MKKEHSENKEKGYEKIDLNGVREHNPRHTPVHHNSVKRAIDGLKDKESCGGQEIFEPDGFDEEKEKNNGNPSGESDR